MNKDPQRARRLAPKAEETGEKCQEAVARRGQNHEHIRKRYDELLAEPLQS